MDTDRRVCQRSATPRHDETSGCSRSCFCSFAPVLMTSVATVCGHFPLTLVSGAGAAARNSIGITVVAGMALGTIFTLLVIPPSMS